MAVTTAVGIEEWREQASRTFVPLQMVDEAPHFSASLTTHALGAEALLSDIHSDGLVIEHAPRRASGDDDGLIHLSLQVRSRGRLAQAGNAVRILPGTLTVTDALRPFALDYSQPGQRHVVVQVTRARLGLDPKTLALVAGTAVHGHNPIRDGFISMLRSIVTTPGTVIDDTVAESVLALAGGMIRAAAAPTSMATLPETAVAVSVREYIAQRAEDPRLTVEDVARAHLLSRTRLYAILRPFEQTPAALILDARLERARRLLQDQRSAHLGLHDVAARSGFGDATTLIRAFRRAHGATPGEWRRAARDGE